MKIRFEGGMLDGHAEEVEHDGNWDDVLKIIIGSPSGNIVGCYERNSLVLNKTSESEAEAVSANFKESKNLTLMPGEVARLIKLKPETP